MSELFQEMITRTIEAQMGALFVAGTRMDQEHYTADDAVDAIRAFTDEDWEKARYIGELLQESLVKELPESMRPDRAMGPDHE